MVFCRSLGVIVYYCLVVALPMVLVLTFLAVVVPPVMELCIRNDLETEGLFYIKVLVLVILYIEGTFESEETGLF
jgi:hypothetical protein